MTPSAFTPIDTAQSPIFTTTCWTVVLTAASDSAVTTDAREAWEHLCRSYWLPLYLFARRRGDGSSDAQDVVQDFFLHLLEARIVTQADRQRGLFRTYLLRCFCNFVSNREKHDAALKRGGGFSFVPLDTLEPAEFDQLIGAQHWSPECVYDLGWAHTLVGRALENLRAEAVGRGKQPWFDELSIFLPGNRAVEPEAAGDEGTLYQDAARRLGKPVETIRTAVHRLRVRFREQVRAEVARTVETPEEVDAELRHLRATLSLSARLGGR